MVACALHQRSALRPFQDRLTDEFGQESPWTMMIADDTGTCSDSREQVEENQDFKYLASTMQGSKVQKKEVRKPVEAERKRQRELLGVTWHGIK